MHIIPSLGVGNKMTESEAKTKWCPMSRLPWLEKGEDGKAVPGNRWGDGRPAEGATCIGSACMMWRRDAITPEEISAYEHGSDALCEELKIPGYCGLAGKP